MKKIFFLFFLLFAAYPTNSYTPVDVNPNWQQLENAPEIQELDLDMINLQLEEFLTLTPKKYRQKTGKRLGLKKSIKLRFAQRMVKKKLNDEPAISKGLFVIMAIFFLGWLSMGIMDDWRGSNWVSNLILTLLTCCVGGFIHAMIKMKDYY